MKIIAAINYVVGFFLNAKKTRITYSLNYLNRARNIDRNYLDYIRLATLELVADELNSAKIEGSVAELGVYKGKFARYINQYFECDWLFNISLEHNSFLLLQYFAFSCEANDFLKQL